MKDGNDEIGIYTIGLNNEQKTRYTLVVHP